MNTLMTGLLAVGFFAISLTAQANVITITDTMATIDCTAGASDPACQGFTGGNPDSTGQPTELGTLSSSMADIFSIISSEASETEALNTLAGTDFLSTDAVKTEAGGGDTGSFSTDALYFLIKTGVGTSFFKNEAGEISLDVVYDKNNTQGGGLSHYTVFGGTIDVPEPAHFVLFALAMLGLALASARRIQAG